ncbi:unnamed protein product [Linum trigynum]|uniref:Uncharacterized protein n=1 Tax=Linum trigynum TaxID=586398 RepID=A0AAV2GBA4_9ROSI
MGAHSSVDEVASCSHESRVCELHTAAPIDSSEIKWSREDVEGILVDNPVDTAEQDVDPIETEETVPVDEATT